MRRRTAALALVAGFLGGCSDDGPSGPSTTPSATTTIVPASTVFTVVSGETGEPVAGAAVTVGGQTLETEGSGQVDAGDISIGVNVGVVAEGFLDRQTVYRGPTESRLVLWPETSDTGLTPEITRRLVYSGFGEDAVQGELSLSRFPVDETIVVLVDPEIPEDPRVDRIVEDSVDAMRAALHDRMTFTITRTRPSSGIVWHVRINPDSVSSEFIAITRWTFLGSERASAEISFRSLPDFVENGRLLTNMLGTAFGLHDSDKPSDRMFFDWWRRQPNNFSPREGLIMRMMLERRAGNRWPDNDRSLGASSLRTTNVRHVRTRPF